MIKGFEHYPDGAEQYLKHPAHAKPGIYPFPDKLYVVTMLSNPLRWRSRYNNYWKFEQHVKQAGAILYTVEVAYGDRQFEITDAGNPQHLQLRTGHELWHKENALNVLISRLPKDAKYIAWIDADVQFARTDWAQETLHLLQHYDFIQMFSHAQDLDENHSPVGATTASFMYQYVEDRPAPESPCKHCGNCICTCGNQGKPEPPFGTCYSGDSTKPATQKWWHPGFAWAARRDALDKVGGLIDWAIMGSADTHMAMALVGKIEKSFYNGYSGTYKRLCLEWQERCNTHIHHNVGYMPGLVNHYWHGEKKNRNYDARWRFLTAAKFDPIHDLKRDTQGLWQIEKSNVKLRDGIRQYNRARFED